MNILQGIERKFWIYQRTENRFSFEEKEFTNCSCFGNYTFDKSTRNLKRECFTESIYIPWSRTGFLKTIYTWRLRSKLSRIIPSSFKIWNEKQALTNEETFTILTSTKTGMSLYRVDLGNTRRRSACVFLAAAMLVWSYHCAKAEILPSIVWSPHNPM